MEEGGETKFFEKEESVETVDQPLVNELTNVKQAIYDKIVLGSEQNNAVSSQKTDNAMYYEYIMRRLCLDMDPSINTSNMVPFDELPQTNRLIKELKEDPTIGKLIEVLIKTYRDLSKSANASHNKKYIQEALIIFPWPYTPEND